jgi:hypothetical protein
MFLESGYLDCELIYNDINPFIFLTGARGIGKTYGFLELFYKKGIKFIYMRRSESEIDYCSSNEGNPFNPINAELGINIEIRKIGKIKGFFYEDKCLGYLMALSTFYSKRSVSFIDIEAILFDEFIPEKNARPIKNEAEAFFNSIETISRNRELKEEKPLKVICASNSNTLDNPIFIELGIVSKALKMSKKKNAIYKDNDRGFSLYMPYNSPISKKKKETSLYKLTSKSKNFQEMALENEFNDEISEQIVSKNLKQFSPLCHVGELYIYIHKTNRSYYISEHRTGTFEKEYGTGLIDLKRFKREYNYLWFCYMRKSISFESYTQQLLFEKYFLVK